METIMFLESPDDICARIGDNGGPAWVADHVPLRRYEPTPEITETIDHMINAFKLRQIMVQSMTKLSLQAQAVLRMSLMKEDDYVDDASKKKARERIEKLYSVIVKDPSHPMYWSIEPYVYAAARIAERRALHEKEMVRLVKTLPVSKWAAETKGLSLLGLATIVGACGDIGTYKSVSAVWKRMGLAVMDGRRQGAPGEGASKDDWIAHGYNGRRRSVAWNVGNSLVLGMGKFRPMYGEDVDANTEYTYYQRVFAHRARYEAERLPKKSGAAIEESKTGKESYSAHAANRAKRYVEKRLLKHLYIEWRKAA